MPRKKNKGTSDDDHAAKWECHPRTIRVWKKQGAPLGDDDKMLVWFTGRRMAPPGTSKIIAKHRAVNAAREAVAEPELAVGAAAALKRLETSEARAYGQFQRLLESGDVTEAKVARENWRVLCDQLRKTDLAIEASRRDAGELVPRDTMVELCYALRWSIYYAMFAFEDVVPQLVGLNTPHEVWKILGPLSDLINAGVVSNLGSRKDVPSWMVKAVQASGTLAKEDEESYAQFAQAMKELMKQQTKKG